jgi:hypothetical protein
MTVIARSTVVADAAGHVSLARDLHRYGRHKAAEALFQQTAAHVEKTLGSHDPMLANILDAYTDFLVSLHREAEAASTRERSNQIRGQARSA